MKKYINYQIREVKATFKKSVVFNRLTAILAVWAVVFNAVLFGVIPQILGLWLLFVAVLVVVWLAAYVFENDLYEGEKRLLNIGE